MATTILEYPTTTNFTSTPRSAAKRPKCRHLLRETNEDDNSFRQPPLLPGLPDDVAQLCLSLVSPSHLYSVCHSWRRLVYSPSFPSFSSIYALFESAEPQPNFSCSLKFCSFDPISGEWTHLPPPPLRSIVRHPSFISRRLPIQSVAVSGKLAIIAATDGQFQPALAEPLLFDPIRRKWTSGPPLPVPRRWCALGTTGATVFVASGIESQYNSNVARSVEKWEIDGQSQRRRWEKLRDLKDGKFCRDAIDAVAWRGKLCMVNVKGGAVKEGTIYDVGTDCWENMPEGMLAGWRGPAASAEKETIYVVDEMKGSLKRYDHSTDSWAEVVENESLKGAQQMAAAKGKLCVLRSDGKGIVVVDDSAPPCVRLWVVEAPPGLQGLAIHVLPRLSHPEIQSK